jgi:putative transposase
MLAMRGASLSYETVRECVLSSVRLMPTACAASLHDPATDGISSRLFPKMNGRLHYLWRAVDQDGDVLGFSSILLVQ